MSEITAEMLMLDTLTDKQIRDLKAIDAFKTVVLDWEHSKHSEAIAFSQQDTFLLGGVEMPLALVVAIAKTKLVNKRGGERDTTETHPVTASLAQEAWNILYTVQAGKEANGEKFNLTHDGLQDFVEATL